MTDFNSSDIATLIDEAEPLRLPPSIEARLRAKAAELRDASLAVMDAAQRLEDAKALVTKIEQRELPDLLSEAGTDHFGLPAEGNHPAADVVLRSWVEARIPKEDERRAHDYLQDEGFGSIVKHTFTVAFGKGEEAHANDLRRLLDESGFGDYEEKTSVHNQTLQAFVKEQLGLGTVLDAELLGIQTGLVARIEVRKDKVKRSRK
jgi:hypothetical protein